MLDWNKILIDGMIYSVIGSIYIVIMLMVDNRMFLNKGDYPDDVLAAVPPRTEMETRKAAIWSLPWFLWAFIFPSYSAYSYAQVVSEVPFWALFAHAFLIFLSFWLVDLVILDGLMFCLITPSFVMIPGTEGFAGYKDFDMHLKGHFTKGILYLVIAGLVVAGVVWFLV
jgi:hypothetical protein